MKYKIDFENSNRKVIFIGDNFQLDFGKKENSSLNPKYFEDNYNLKTNSLALDDKFEISPIIEQVHSLVNGIRGKIYNNLSFQKSENFNFLNRDEVLPILKNRIGNKQEFRLLRFSNKQAYDANYWIKKDIINNGEDLRALLTNFTITNGNGYGGGGISIGLNVSSSPSIINNIIINNTAFYGGAIYCENSYAIFHHNVIAFNSGDTGGGIYRDDDGSIEILNCTIYGNESNRGGGIYSSSYDIVKNSIIYNNTASQDGNNIQGSNLFISYSDIQNGYDGEGNIDSNPEFTDPDNGDYTLQEDSDCIDAGTADTDMDGNNDMDNYNGTAPDIGLFEFDDGGCGIIGDINIDSDVNILDIITIANCILSNCSDPCADLNLDGTINILDIINLVNIILSFY